MAGHCAKHDIAYSDDEGRCFMCRVGGRGRVEGAAHAPPAPRSDPVPAAQAGEMYLKVLTASPEKGSFEA